MNRVEKQQSIMRFEPLTACPSFGCNIWKPIFILISQVDFVSTSVKKYEIALVVDVDGVGEEILSLPITAKYDHFIFPVVIFFPFKG